jgi:hypothetical protein
MLAKVGKRSVINYRVETTGAVQDRAKRIDPLLNRARRGMRSFWMGSAPAGLTTVGICAV